MENKVVNEHKCVVWRAQDNSEQWSQLTPFATWNVKKKNPNKTSPLSPIWLGQAWRNHYFLAWRVLTPAAHISSNQVWADNQTWTSLTRDTHQAWVNSFPATSSQPGSCGSNCFWKSVLPPQEHGVGAQPSAEPPGLCFGCDQQFSGTCLTESNDARAVIQGGGLGGGHYHLVWWELASVKEMSSSCQL